MSNIIVLPARRCKFCGESLNGRCRCSVLDESDKKLLQTLLGTHSSVSVVAVQNKKAVKSKNRYVPEEPVRDNLKAARKRGTKGGAKGKALPINTIKSRQARVSRSGAIQKRRVSSTVSNTLSDELHKVKSHISEYVSQHVSKIVGPNHNSKLVESTDAVDAITYNYNYTTTKSYNNQPQNRGAVYETPSAISGFFKRQQYINNFVEHYERCAMKRPDLTVNEALLYAAFEYATLGGEMNNSTHIKAAALKLKQKISKQMRMFNGSELQEIRRAREFEPYAV